MSDAPVVPGPTLAVVVLSPETYALLDVFAALAKVLGEGNPGDLIRLADELRQRADAVADAPPPTGAVTRFMPLCARTMACVQLAVSALAPPEAEDKSALADIASNVLQFPAQRPRPFGNGDGGDSGYPFMVTEADAAAAPKIVSDEPAGH